MERPKLLVYIHSPLMHIQRTRWADGKRWDNDTGLSLCGLPTALSVRHVPLTENPACRQATAADLDLNVCKRCDAIAKKYGIEAHALKAHAGPRVLSSLRWRLYGAIEGWRRGLVGYAHRGSVRA